MFVKGLGIKGGGVQAGAEYSRRKNVLKCCAGDLKYCNQKVIKNDFSLRTNTQS